MGTKIAICAFAIPIFDPAGRMTVNAQGASKVSINSLSPREREVCSELGISEHAFIAQKRDPIFGRALFAETPANRPFPGKRASSPFPDAPRGFISRTSADASDDTDDEPGYEAAIEDPLGFRRRAAGVTFPNGKRI